MLRRTKIIATLGPATDNPLVLERTLNAGVDVVRVNFSHGTEADHAFRINSVRAVAAKSNRHIAILADLQGPKIRVAKFKHGKILLKNKAHFVLDAELDSNLGDENVVGIDYKDLPYDVKDGDVLLLNDGLIELKVEQVLGPRIICQVITGGELSNNKGINRLGGGLTAKALTDKDRSDLKIAAKLGIDYLAISFPRNADDVKETQALLREENCKAGVIAKIERAEALQVLDEIINAADGVMVARGDLGVEIGDAELPAAQKHIIHQARSLNKPVITATQMMESMIHSPMPTRAEVFDVANAVLDGTDAVMLSAETAAGDNPDKVVAAMARICIGAEQQRMAQVSKHRMEKRFHRVDEAVAMATMYTANHLDIKAIITLTESGSTSLWMSRIRSGIPIYGLSRHEATLRRMTLYRGVYPVEFHLNELPRDEIHRAAVNELQKRGIVKEGDWIIITRGDLIGVHGLTNSLKIVEVGQVY